MRRLGSCLLVFAFAKYDRAAVGEVGVELAVEGVVSGVRGEAIEAFEFGLVGVEEVLVGAGGVGGEAVIGDAVIGVEVEGEDEVGTLELEGEVALVEVEKLSGGRF